MSIPYELKPQEYTVPATGRLIRLPLPSRGFIHRLVVVEDGESPAGDYKVDLFKRADAVEADEEDNLVPIATADLHRVFPQQTVAGSARGAVVLSETGLPYTTTGGENLSTQDKALYLLIKPTSGSRTVLVSATLTGAD